MIDSASTGNLPGAETRLNFKRKTECSTASRVDDSVQQKAVRFGNLEPASLTLIKHGTLPLVTVLVLTVCMLIAGQVLSAQFWALGLLAFLVSAQILGPLDLRTAESFSGRARRVPRILLEWSCVAAVLVFLKVAFRTQLFPATSCSPGSSRRRSRS